MMTSNAQEPANDDEHAGACEQRRTRRNLQMTTNTQEPTNDDKRTGACKQQRTHTLPAIDDDESDASGVEKRLFSFGEEF